MRPDYCAVANGDPGGDIRPVPDPYIISNCSDFYLGGRLAVSCPIIVVMFGCLKTVAKFEYPVPSPTGGFADLFGRIRRMNNIGRYVRQNSIPRLDTRTFPSLTSVHTVSISGSPGLRARYVWAG